MHKITRALRLTLSMLFLPFQCAMPMSALRHMPQRVLCPCTLLACMVCGAQAWAADQSTLVINTDVECAAEDGREALIQALKARLGAETSYLTSVDEQTPHWTLTWAKNKKEACTLSLRDIEPVMTLPLEKGATSERMQEVLVRIVWMVSTQSPRTPELPPVAVATPTKPPPEPITPAPVTPKPASPDPPADVEPKEPKSSKPPEKTEVAKAQPKKTPTKPTSGDGEFNGNEPLTLSTLSSLEKFRASFPGLFGYDHLNTTSALEVNWADEPTLLSPHIGWTVGSGILFAQPTTINKISVGVLTDRSFGLGFSYRELSASNVVSWDSSLPEGSTSKVRVRSGSVDAEYLLMPGSDIHLAFGLSLGAGNYSWLTRQSDGDAIRDSQTMLLVDVDARFYYDATDWLQVGFGFSWHSGFHWAFDNQGPSPIAGPSGSMTLRVGLF